MPISYGNVEKQLKILPISLNIDGTATVIVKYGFVENEVFSPYAEKSVHITKEGVDAVLDSAPTPTLTRREDLSLAVYNYLIDNDLVESGQVS